jgi:5'-methylthioadenosine phosphorylase
MWAVIGGSGFEKFDGVEKLRSLDRKTPFGEASSGFALLSHRGREFLFIPRHGESHELSPSEVNYAANIYAMKRQGAKQLLAFSAVGSLQAELAPGDLVVPAQFIDRTKGLRRVSFSGGGIVAHVSLADPVWSLGTAWLKSAAKKYSFRSHFDKTAIVIEGPYFSTRAESHAARAVGADIIGMTAFPEFALAREAGLAYLPASFVTDFDSWNDKIEHVTIAEVIRVMRENNAKAFQILGAVLESGLERDEATAKSGLNTGLMTKLESLSGDKRIVLETLLR